MTTVAIAPVARLIPSPLLIATEIVLAVHMSACDNDIYDDDGQPCGDIAVDGDGNQRK